MNQNRDKKNPAADATASGAYQSSAGSSKNPATIAVNEDTAKDAIWDGCREARASNITVDAPWFNAKQLRAAQAQLRFVQDNRGRWWLARCPHCGGWVKLCAYSSGSIRASSYGDEPYCSAVDSINRWLRDQGFQSEGGAA